MTNRITTIRIPENTAKAIELAARTENISVSEAIRKSIDWYIDLKRKDPDFQKRLSLLFESERDTYETLKKK